MSKRRTRENKYETSSLQKKEQMMTCGTKKTQFDKFLSKIVTVIESAGHNVIHISDIQNAKKITTDRCSKVLVYFSGKIVVQGSLEHRDSLKGALQSQNFNVS